MADIITEVVGMLEVNCYLVPVGNKLYIIDPGGDVDSLVKLAEPFRSYEKTILLTHAHIDHILGVSTLAKMLGIKNVYLHKNDHELYYSPANSLPPWLPPATDLPKPVSELNTDDFEIIETPGHTQGGVCFYFPEHSCIFVGDTLFAGSVGRTDLPGGNHQQLLESIHNKLMSLPNVLKVYPGHGASTSIGREKTTNPYL